MRRDVRGVTIWLPFWAIILHQQTDQERPQSSVAKTLSLPLFFRSATHGILIVYPSPHLCSEQPWKGQGVIGHLRCHAIPDVATLPRFHQSTAEHIVRQKPSFIALLNPYHSRLAAPLFIPGSGIDCSVVDGMVTDSLTPSIRLLCPGMQEASTNLIPNPHREQRTWEIPFTPRLPTRSV